MTSANEAKRDDSSRRLGRNVHVLSAVAFLNDVSTEMIYPLLPVFSDDRARASAGSSARLKARRNRRRHCSN
jgi:hypothetical protein